MNNLETVREIYRAFGEGDVDGVLAHMADDVELDYNLQDAPTPVPWLQARHGHSGAREFFEALGEGLEMKAFSPHTIVGSDETIVVLVDLEATVRSTGKPVIERDEAHIWHFNADGKVARMRHGADSYQHAMALTS